MKQISFFILIFSLFSGLFAGEAAQKYDEKSFAALFKAVSKHYSKEELRKIVEKSIIPDENTEKRLDFIYSPVSIKKQEEAHADLTDKMVNDETVRNGVDFFNKYNGLLCKTYSETKVEPGDVIAILNWESKLGTITGDQQIIKIFAPRHGQERPVQDHLLRRAVLDRPLSRRPPPVRHEDALPHQVRRRGALSRAVRRLGHGVLRHHGHRGRQPRQDRGVAGHGRGEAERRDPPEAAGEKPKNAQ